MKDHLTISTNLFGTTFYSLVGLHASHVIVGLTFLLIVLIVTSCGLPDSDPDRRVQVSFLVLAFRRCGLGRGLHGCLYHWKVTTWRRTNKNHDYPDSVDMPAPSFWPMIRRLD